MKLRKRVLMFSGLRFRIMLPAVVFILIFSFLFIILNNYYTSKLLDERLDREAVRISKILYESRFVLNPVYLKRLGQVIEGRIAVFDYSGKIVTASFDDAGADDFLFYVNPSDVRTRHANDSQEQIVMKVHKANRSFLLVTRKLFFSNTKESILIAILTPLDDLQTAKSQTVLRTILSGSLALLIAFIAAGFVLKKISASIRDILLVTDKIASGDFSCKAILSDITELKTLALSINQMSDKLMEYEKKLIDSTRLISANKITAAMAHEIKNPLSSMKMLAQIIQKRFEHDKEGSQMTATFIREINRVDTLVSDLRTLSWPVQLSCSMENPRLPLEDVITVIAPKLDHLNISLTLHIEPDIPKILMDKDKIKQVLWNLMMNGAQSMPQGGNLDVFLKMRVKEGFIEYSIKDYGSGITQTDMDHIFTPFFTTKKEGIGIGLHVSKEIARAHKGEIKIMPAKTGTTAVLLIPCNNG
ncbi:MAG: ATP-binding protein [Desulfobacula sp.]|jgi:signal transduction histidine kinase|nr:ATP-binding protein [Desulfobacula sp.]